MEMNLFALQILFAQENEPADATDTHKHHVTTQMNIDLWLRQN